MNDPPSDENERIADIFILSTDETVAVQLEEHLGKKEYRVTFFHDDAKLEETLPTNKPDLLIFDTKTGEQEVYEVIRRIKADENQRGIPVLVLTSASTVEDLLKVLESNADNFIAPPYDLPDHLSLIDDMLTTPVERQTRDEIEKQFRVRYGDKTFVVAASRRKLLEFLLSSFDIVERTSSELSSATTKLQALSQSATELEQTIAGQTRATEALHTTVRQKEQEIIALTREGEERKKILEKKTNELNDLTVEFDALRQQLGKLQETLASSNKALETERELRRVSEENTKAALQQQEDLEKHVRRANEEVERLKQEQAAVAGQLQEELENAASRIQSLESEVNTLSIEKLLTEQEIRTRSQSATEMEQTIARQTEATETLQATVRQKEQEIIALTREDEAQKKILEKKTNELNDLTVEFDALRLQVGKLQETLISSNKALETERELRRVSEENTRVAVQQQEDLEKHVRRANVETERVKQEQAAVAGQLQEELKKAASRIQSLESEVSTLSIEKMHAGQEIRTLTAELGRNRTMRANVYTNHPGIDEGNADAGKERPVVQQSLFSDEKNSPKEDLDLVIPEESNLPTPVKQVARQITGEVTPGLQQPIVSKKDQASSEPPEEIPSEFPREISGLSGVSAADSIVMLPETVTKKVNMAPGTTIVHKPSAEKIVEIDSQEGSSALNDQIVQPAPYADIKPEKETAEKPESLRSEAGSGTQSDETAEESGGTAPSGDFSFTSKQWLDLLKWAHHSDALSRNQRQKIVMMGRLIQKDGKLTKRQQEQVREILSFVYALGYRP